MSNEEYIQDLEEENEMLRQKIRDYESLLEESWTNSKTLNLIPDRNFFYADNAREVKHTKLITKSWSSLLGLREYILERGKTHEIHIWPDQKTQMLWTTFNEEIIGGKTRSNYRVRFCAIPKEKKNINDIF